MRDKHAFLNLKRDSFLYLPDDQADHIYMIANGGVKIGHYFDDGEGVINAILTTGEIFGQLAVAGESTRSDCIQLMDDHIILCP